MKQCRRIFKASYVAVFIVSSWFLALTVPNAGAAEQITLATTEWPPHYSQKVENGGYVSEISREAFRRGGYELEIVFVPWKRALEGAKRGKYDGVMGIYITPERTHVFEFTDPIWQTRLVFITRADSNLPETYSSYEELTAVTIGVPRGYLLPKELEEAELNFEFSDGDEQNLLKLLKRRIDLILDYGNVAYYLINTKHPEHQGKIRTILPPVNITPFYNVISKKKARSEEIVVAFNRGLVSMNEDGTFEAILTKHGMLPVE